MGFFVQGQGSAIERLPQDLELLVALGALAHVVRELLAERRVVDALVEQRADELEEAIAVDLFFARLVEQEAFGLLLMTRNLALAPRRCRRPSPCSP